jgi:C4-dicarboxylate-specific signal transduction histidine kinase
MAHSLNNIFTAILGEASHLQSVRKHDREVDEACLAIRESVERCGRLTRALLERHHDGPIRERIVDLSTVVGDTARLLTDALSRRFDMEAEPARESLPVRGDPIALQSILLLLVQRAEDAVRGAARLRLRALQGEEEDTVCLEVELSAPGLAVDGSEILRETELADVSTRALAVRALLRVADAQSARLETSSDPDVLRLRAVFAATDDDVL